jgi:hypothetical protein
VPLPAQFANVIPLEPIDTAKDGGDFRDVPDDLEPDLREHDLLAIGITYFG